MVQHADIDHSGLTGIPAGGSVATDAIWDAAGDLAVGTGANTAARLAAGATSGHVLTSNGSGVAPSWQAAAGGGGGGDYVLIDEVVVAGSAATQMNITAIPNTYRDLIIVILARTTNAAVQSVLLQFGDGAIDTGSNYRFHRDSTGSGNVASASASATSVSAGMATETGATAGNFTPTTIELMAYADSTIWRAMHHRSTYYSADRYANNGGGFWMNTADEIERVRATLSAGDFEIGSRMTIYGRG